GAGTAALATGRHGGACVVVFRAGTGRPVADPAGVRDGETVAGRNNLGENSAGPGAVGRVAEFSTQTVEPPPDPNYVFDFPGAVWEYYLAPLDRARQTIL